MRDDPDENEKLVFNVNGRDCIEANIDPEITLASYLRNNLGLRGTKLGCEEGICGSCTVVIGKWIEKDNKAHYVAVNACLVPIFQVHRRFVITIEGVGSRDMVHPIQERLVKGHAVQCGFCSPGFVMAAYALLRNNPKPSIQDINSAIRANRCRCTGYRPILEALYSLSDQAPGCCGGKGKAGGCCKDVSMEFDAKLQTFADFPKYDQSQEVIFPPSLLAKKAWKSLRLAGPRVIVHLPCREVVTTLTRFCDRKIRLLGSGMISHLTGDLMNSQTNWVSPLQCASLNEVRVTGEKLFVGCALSIQELVDAVQMHCQPELAESVREFFDKYSSAQVSNFASWTGALVSSLMSATRVGDVLTLFAGLDWRVVVDRCDGECDYDTTLVQLLQLLSDEKDTFYISHAVIPLKGTSKLFAFKQGEAGEADTTCVNMVAAFDESSQRFRAFLGISGGLPVNIQQVADVASKEEFDLDDMLNALMTTSPKVEALCWRNRLKMHLARAAICKFYEFLRPTKAKNTAAKQFNYLQYFKPAKEMEGTSIGACGRPLVNYFADKCTTGEAIYIDDMKTRDTLYVGVVLSKMAHAKLVDIDYNAAMTLPGVVAHFDFRDVKGTNRPGLLPINLPAIDDTPIFAEDEVHSIGQLIAIVVAEDVATARRGAQLVKISYTPLKNVITINEAIEMNSYNGDIQYYGRPVEDVETTLKTCSTVVEGTVRGTGQEHFYMEPQSSLVIPGEGDEMLVHSSTQSCYYVQAQISSFLGVTVNKIVVRVKAKRLGGAFGGKVTNTATLACAAALAASKLRRPTNVCLTRKEDLIFTGKRHGFSSNFRVGVDDGGKVKAAFVQNYLNGGFAKDHTNGVTMVTSSRVDGVYDFGVARSEGHPLKTNTCSNTAMRGYGHPQAWMVTEGIMRMIAKRVGRPLEEVTMVTLKVKQTNFNINGGQTLAGLTIHHDALDLCWAACKEMSDFEKRREDTLCFNRNSKTIKRGIAMSAVRYPLPVAGYFGHGVALVQINLDGSVTVSIGGIDMGQGLYMKCIQVASTALNRPVESITIVDTSSDKTTNALETGGSQGSDVNGKAILACCERLMKALQPFVDKEKDWNAAVLAAYFKNVPLQCSEYGVFSEVVPGENQTENEGVYNTSGAATVEVELDCITGIQKLVRVDITMDLGESLNPAIDIGQIEGAFMQGYGWMTCEKVEFDEKTGELLQNTAAKYKLPTAEMVPSDFRIKLIGAGQNSKKQVYSSKGVGEPPLLLATAANTAILQAVEDFRAQNGLDDFIPSSNPLTTAKILELCYPDQCLASRDYE